MADMSSAPHSLRASVTRLSSRHRRPWPQIPLPSLGRPTVAVWAAIRTAEPEVDLSGAWIQVGAYLERKAPDDVSAEELGRVEDAAAERIYQGSRRGTLAS
jgi:hypothetical protein